MFESSKEEQSCLHNKVGEILNMTVKYKTWHKVPVPVFPGSQFRSLGDLLKQGVLYENVLGQNIKGK